MSRKHRFIVTMEVPDDGQTDPEDMASILEDVLNCRAGACADWQQGRLDMMPEYRPIIQVDEASAFNMSDNENAADLVDRLVTIIESAVYNAAEEVRYTLKAQLGMS